MDGVGAALPPPASPGITCYDKEFPNSTFRNRHLECYVKLRCLATQVVPR